jgi:hypothetical protein
MAQASLWHQDSRPSGGVCEAVDNIRFLWMIVSGSLHDSYVAHPDKGKVKRL